MATTTSKKKNTIALYSTKWIAYTAMLTALVIATSYIPAIPTVAGRIYWVDGVVLIAAYLMDPLASFIIGGIGTLLYDVLVGNPAMMVWSLLIHGLQGAVVSLFVHYVFPKKTPKIDWIWGLISSLIGAVIVVGGYFTYRTVVYGTSTALASIPRNLIQEAIGISIAMVICYATTFKQQLEKSHLLPDFSREVMNKQAKQPAQAKQQPAA
jgi:uncharacterized membrane protein